MALTMESGFDLDRLLEKIEAVPPMVVADIDFTMNDPDAVRSHLGRPLRRSAKIENDVAEESLVALLPNLSDQRLRFIRAWVNQERGHGESEDKLLLDLGIEPLVAERSVGFHNIAIGLLGRMSESTHRVFEMLYLTRGAMHERLTMTGYRLMYEKLGELGETALQENVLRPIRAQETPHYRYYYHAAQELKADLTPQELGWARRLSVATYAPVGASAEADKPDWGHIVTVLTEGKDKGIREFTQDVQQVARELLLDERKPYPGFIPNKLVYRAIKRCIEANQKQAQPQDA